MSKDNLHRGRCVAIDPQQVTVRNLAGVVQLTYTKVDGPAPQLGDLVEVSDDTLRILTPNRTQDRRTRFLDQILHPRRLKGVQTRTQVEAGIRAFFQSRGFFETRTPLLVPCPGMEPHIRPLSVRGTGDRDEVRCYLPTSPEFAMKRLLVGGLEKIFQLSPAFRDEPKSVTHRPEFTMLEWYRAYAGYEEIMRDTEELLEALATRLFGKPTISYQGKNISVKTPWPRLRVRDLFRDHAGVDLVRSSTAEQLAHDCERLGLSADLKRENWDDLYFKIWLNRIEPKLPEDQAVFVTRYPASQAALAVIDSDPDGSRWAKRFEFYAGGLELGNAFEELTDPGEQRSRFEKDMRLRSEVYGAARPPSPIDEGFLEALTEGMPPAGGIAVGVDRLVMLFAQETDIAYTHWLESREGQT